jgi:hypothetical protein
MSVIPEWNINIKVGVQYTAYNYLTMLFTEGCLQDTFILVNGRFATLLSCSTKRNNPTHHNLFLNIIINYWWVEDMTFVLIVPQQEQFVTPQLTNLTVVRLVCFPHMVCKYCTNLTGVDLCVVYLPSVSIERTWLWRRLQYLLADGQNDAL